MASKRQESAFPRVTRVGRGNGWEKTTRSSWLSPTIPEGGVTNLKGSSVLEPRNRRAEVRACIVPERLDIGMAIECGLNHPALDAAPSSMDDAHLAEAGRRGRAHMLLDDRGHVARRETSGGRSPARLES